MGIFKRNITPAPIGNFAHANKVWQHQTNYIEFQLGMYVCNILLHWIMTSQSGSMTHNRKDFPGTYQVQNKSYKTLYVDSTNSDLALDQILALFDFLILTQLGKWKKVNKIE